MLQDFVIANGKRSQELSRNLSFTYRYVYVEDVKGQTAALYEKQGLYWAYGPTRTQI